MNTPAIGVIKKDRIKQGGAVRVSAAQEPAASPSAAGSAATARIVEQANGCAVVEVRCECGKTILLRCEYEPNA